MRSVCNPCGKQNLRGIATLDLVSHITNLTYSLVWSLVVKSLPNPAWLFLANLFSHRVCDHHSRILQHHLIMIAHTCMRSVCNHHSSLQDFTTPSHRDRTHIRRMRSVCNHHSKILQHHRMRSVCNHHSKILQHHRIIITRSHTRTHTTYAIRL